MYPPRRLFRFPLTRSALATLAIGIAVALPTWAQNYEAFYGEATSQDRAEDVQSVNHCSGGGAITAGTRSTAAGNEVLLTRVDDVGIEIWQTSYRIGDYDFSSAGGIIEYRNGGGFAVTGSATRGDTQIFAMRVSCEGKPQWTVILENSGQNHRGIGNDLIELPAASATIGQGDLIVVGDERIATFPTSVGRIARIDPSGNVIFDNAYIRPNNPPGLRFRGVTLAHASTGLMTDLVIAGSTGGVFPNWSYDRRALMFRTDTLGTPRCNAVLGNNDSLSQEYWGVASVNALGAYNGQTILVGTSTLGAAGASTLGYLTRFRAGNCEPLLQAHWAFPGDNPEAMDVVEFPSSVLSGPARFAVTGNVRGASGSDGFVAWANVGTLAPFLPTQRFGRQQIGNETLRAMDVKGNRLLLAGQTTRDWEFIGDPSDVYLVQTDPTLLRTQCSQTWTILSSDPALPHERFEPAVVPIERATKVETVPTKRSGAGYCCGLNAG